MVNRKRGKKENININIKKETLKRILFVIVVIVVLALFYLGVQEYAQNSYERGVTDGANSIIDSQTKSGEFYIKMNDSITQISMDELCDGYTKT